MTTKDKAKELVEKFYPFAYCSDGNNSMNRNYQIEENSKQCALICVDEIINANVQEEFEGHMVDEIGAVDYWREVKQEIEKL